VGGDVLNADKERYVTKLVFGFAVLQMRRKMEEKFTVPEMFSNQGIQSAISTRYFRV
jgi:hypothetical protein